MIKPPIPNNEQERLEELYSYDILDTSYEDEFDEIVKLASIICNTTISTITLVDSSRQWFKAKIGLNIRESSRDNSFCAHAIATNTELFQIEDTLKSEIFFDNPLVIANPEIRFYAGVPLVSSRGFNLGTLCVIDSKPKLLDQNQTFALKVLGTQVIKLLEFRIMNKQLEAQQKRQKLQLEMQNKIISVIAHDVRNPVASLKNIIELTNSNILSEVEGKELTIMAEKQLDETLILLSDLIEWGKMQISAQKMQYEKIHLHTLVTDKLKNFEIDASLKGNKLVNLIDSELVFNSDPNVISFILRNLIGNANKFTSNGTISVYAHKEYKKILIVVNDTGVGMSSDRVKKLFGDGERHTTLGTNKEKGTGLGLFLTKDFIEILGGTLRVESVEGKGTTILIELSN